MTGLANEAVRGLSRLPDPRERPWLTVTEVAEITGEGEKAIRAALQAGQLPILRIGRYVRIPTAALYEVCRISPDKREGEPATGSPIAADSTALETRREHGTALRAL